MPNDESVASGPQAADPANPTGTPAPSPPREPKGASLRLWPAVVLIVAQWLIMLIPGFLVPGSLTHVACLALAPLVTFLAIFVWWTFASRVPGWSNRLAGIGIFLFMAVCTGFAIHHSMYSAALFHILPSAMTVLVVALLVTRRIDWQSRRTVVLCAIALTFSLWAIVRCDGTDGSMNMDYAWRWSATPEEILLAAGETGMASGQTVTLPAELHANDWPSFRGFSRNSLVQSVSFPTNWSQRPPQLLWRRPVGPGWSSFCVVGDYLFTQEQRGKDEAVVCYHAETGEMCWISKTKSRFYEIASGAGPRATPTYHDGQLFTMGAKGDLRCIRADTGKELWARDVLADANARLLTWGMSSSPLVVGDLVLAFAGGERGNSIIAYHLSDGKLAWKSGNGTLSYSSPHPARVAGKDVVLMATNLGIEALEPTTGKVDWTYRWGRMGERITQPQSYRENMVVMGADNETRLLQVQTDGEEPQIVERWSSTHLKPSFNDFVLHNNCAYGFDGNVLACIDMATGKRHWKRGRYGFGQVLLLADMSVLLVVSETGEIILVRADPDRHVELGRFQAIEGKTWNHPVVAHGKLFLRNSQEAACFRLSATDTTSRTELAE